MHLLFVKIIFFFIFYLVNSTYSSVHAAGKMQALPPTYVRSLNISNNYDYPIALQVQFESCEKRFTVEPGAILQVEGTIDKGSWTAVDPVKSVTGVPANDSSKATTFAFQSTFGVAVFHVTLSPHETDGTVKFTITNPQ